MQKKSHSLMRILLIQAGILLAVVGPISLAMLFRKPIQIGYHRLNARLSAKAMARSARASQGAPDERYTRRYKSHRDALIHLGYFEKHTYNLELDSATVRRILEEAHREFPGHPYGLSHGKDLSIIDRPDKMDMWDELVKKYSTSSEDPCQPAESADTSNVSTLKMP